MPGLGIILGAEFLAAAGGDMTVFGTADRLAGFGGVAPVPRDSGEVSGNLRRPQRYNRRLQRVLYTSALFSIRHYEESRKFYDRKRAEGKRHTQAVLALGPPTRERPLGTPTRRAVLRARPTQCPRGLTDSIRNH